MLRQTKARELAVVRDDILQTDRISTEAFLSLLASFTADVVSFSTNTLCAREDSRVVCRNGTNYSLRLTFSYHREIKS